MAARLGACIVGIGDSAASVQLLSGALRAGLRRVRCGGELREGRGELALRKALEAAGEGGSAPAVEMSSRVSLSAGAISQEVKASLARLGTDRLHSVWIDGPELRLMQLGGDRAALRRELEECFAELEHLRRAGTIGGFEVHSSIWQAADEEDARAVALEDICDAASAAADGPSASGLAGVQLPLNVLEPWSLEVAAAARSRGLQVTTLRPHVAALPSGVWCLTDRPRAPPTAYQEKSAAVLDRFSFRLEDGDDATEEERELAEGCAWLRQLVQDMHRRIVVFTSPQHYEQEMLSTLVPLINEKFAGIDEESLELLTAFFEAYEQMVRHHAGQRARELVRTGAAEVPQLMDDSGEMEVQRVECASGAHGDALADGVALEDFAVDWVLGQDHVDCAMVDLATLPARESDAERLFGR